MGFIIILLQGYIDVGDGCWRRFMVITISHTVKVNITKLVCHKHLKTVTIIQLLTSITDEPKRIVIESFFENFEKPCPEDVYDFWAPWTECSISCGGEGVQTRKRNCATSFFRYSPEFPLSKPCRDNPGTEVSF